MISIKQPLFLTHSTWQRYLCFSKNSSLIFKGKLYGRGATDNKGPVLAWINAVSTFRALEEVGNQPCLGRDDVDNSDCEDNDDNDDVGSEGDDDDSDDNDDGDNKSDG